MSAAAPSLARPGSVRGVRPALRSLVRGHDDDAGWIRPALLGILLLAAVLTLWNLTENGWSNTYYAAAAKSATESWKALFFGSLDPGSFITVDKPPLSIWLMGLSGRLLGFSSFSMLLPQALCTIAAVGLLFTTVRRVLGAHAGLIAAAALAITPITIAIGRVNNPDALLILLLVGSAYATVRALGDGRTRHLVLAGVLVGLAFMTKMLQGWMVVPALVAVYLLAGPPRLLVRIRQLALAGVAMVVASAAWPVAVSLWPGSSPYIGGSDDGSVWNLILGYNGFGRLTGNEGGMGGGGGASFGGTAGLLRMFNAQVGGQIAWLLPLAGVGLLVGLWVTRRAPRTDLRRAGIVLFGVWALVHVAVFSSQKGIFHPYYVSALAPAVAALAGGGIVLLAGWARRSWVAIGILDLTLAGSAWLAVDLLDRAPDYAAWLRIVVPVAAAVAILASPALKVGGPRTRRIVALGAVAGAVAFAAGPASWSAANVSRSLNGNNVLAGPASASSGMGGFGGGGPSGGGPSGGGAPSGTRPTGTPPQGATSGTRPAGAASFQGGGGGMGGGGSLSTSAISYLKANMGSAKYLVAATGSQTTASIIISTGLPVVTIGGFSGSDDAPTVSQLAAMVKKGELKYVLVSSGGAGARGGSSALTSWVTAHGTKVTGVTVSSGTLYKVTA